jgi:hypothetical protein
MIGGEKRERRERKRSGKLNFTIKITLTNL